MNHPPRVFIKPGSLIIFEGLDATGKSTQMDRIKSVQGALFADPVPHFTHQPSGGTPVGNYVYQITENANIVSALARQFLHLASHAEHWQVVLAHELRHRAVFMDRWWWSTMAYGYFHPAIYENEEISFHDFMSVAQWPVVSANVVPEPAVLFLFEHEYAEDPHNTDALRKGYQKMARHFEDLYPVVRVKEGTPEEVTTQIFDTLVDLNIADVVQEANA